MNIWIKRSLAVVAISGGLVLAGTAAANADEDHSSSNRESSFSAPVEIGGVDASYEREDSSSRSSGSSRTDENGTSSSRHSESQHDRDAGGVHTDPVSADPGGAFESGEDSRSEDVGSIERSSDDSDRRGTAQAPVHVGGATVYGEHQESSRDAESDSRTDQDGTRSSSSRSSDSRRSGGALSTGAVDAAPRGGFRDAEQSGSESVGDGIDSQESASDRMAGGSAPYSFEGFGASAYDEQRSSDTSSSTVTDEDGTRSSSDRDHRWSDRSFGGGSGAVTGDPRLSARDRQQESDERVGDDTNRGSTSDRRASYASPFDYDGFGTGGRLVQGEAQQERSSMTDEDGTSSSEDSDRHATDERPAFGFGGTEGAPAGRAGSGDLREQQAG